MTNYAEVFVKSLQTIVETLLEGKPDASFGEIYEKTISNSSEEIKLRVTFDDEEKGKGLIKFLYNNICTALDNNPDFSFEEVCEKINLSDILRLSPKEDQENINAFMAFTKNLYDVVKAGEIAENIKCLLIVSYKCNQ